MQLHEFLGRVQQRASIDSREQALDAIRATYQTLSERLQGGEPLDLAGQLPSLLQNYAAVGEGERFDTNEFFHRVADREGVNEDQAREHARAVLEVTSEAVSNGEIGDVLSQLPQEYHGLFGDASQGKRM
jgi:uncharacterized protein (DUF2267 family)